MRRKRKPLFTKQRAEATEESPAPLWKERGGREGSPAQPGNGRKRDIDQAPKRDQEKEEKIFSAKGRKSTPLLAEAGKSSSAEREKRKHKTGRRERGIPAEGES